MQVTAKLRHLRIAPRKVRLLADLIRGKKVTEAKTLLNFSLKKGREPLKKLLSQAITNASNSFQLGEEELWVSEIKVDEGPKLKRWRARARGRAAEIQKKTCHITLILSGEERKRELKKPKEKLRGKEEVPKEKPKLRAEAPKPEKEITPTKPSVSRKRIFRRKAF
ncbi:50S ribosomal protein L22 [Patescibacteria group bacterium]|nr:50S ribosomal protein L22 [Patescibacteria group bacterium]